MNEENINNDNEIIRNAETLNDDTETSAEDLYTYDADDEPVNDRDFYKDFTGEVFTAIRRAPEPSATTAPKAAPAPEAPKEKAAPEQTKEAPVPHFCIR